MKLTYFQLEAQLAKKIAPAYIVSGDELLLKHDACQLIRQSAQQAGFTERVRITPEASFDWEQLYSLFNTTSLFGEKRLIEFDFRDSTPPKQAGALLQEYAQHPSNDQVLLIDISKIDDKIAKSAWYQALEKIGNVITIWPVPREQLPQWIITRAKTYQLTIKLDAAEVLANYVEGNLIAAAQAIEKLYLLNPAQAIDAELIHTLLTDESRFTVFDLVDSFISGDKAKSLQILDNLKVDGLEPAIILWGLTRELRLLAELAQLTQQGQSFDQLAQKYRLFARRQTAIRQFLKRTSPHTCWHYLEHTTQIDRIIKGAAPGNIWDALQLFCLRA